MSEPARPEPPYASPSLPPIGQPYVPQPYAQQPYAQQPYAQQPYAQQPYAAPTYPATYAQPTPLAFDVRGNRGLGITLLVITGGVVLGRLAQAATAFSAANALQTQRVGATTLAPSVVAYLASWLSALLYVPAWIVAALWLVRMHRNAVSVNPRLVRRSVVWAWLSWVLPIVSLLMPKRFLDEAWVATAAALPEGDPDAEVVWTGPWWTFWLLFQFLSGITLTFGGIIVRPDRTVLPAVEIVVTIVCLLAYATWMRVVLRACDTQVALERSLRSGVVTKR